MRYLRSSLFLFLLLLLVTGLAYPLLTTMLAQWLLPTQANGSLIYRGNAVVGSSLVGQSFTRAGYFQGRPSATSDAPYNALASGGSNLAASNPAQDKRVNERTVYWQKLVGHQQPVPAELLLASGSGLDPQISPEAARYQALHIAQARGMSLQQVQHLIDRLTETSKPAFIGQPTVNVLRLNLALDKEKPLP